jgi:hypothetical protein
VLYAPIDGQDTGDQLAVGDLSGDGIPDLVLGADGVQEYNWVVPRPTPVGLVDLSTVQVANFYTGGFLSFALSVGDWDGDGIGDLAIAHDQKIKPYGSSGLLVYRGPIIGEYNLTHNPATPPWAVVDSSGLDDPADPNHNSGLSSRLIPDIDGDGAADALVSGEFWTDIAPYEGHWPGPQGGFALFSGDQTGTRNVDEDLATLYGVCDPDLYEPRAVGDVTGDGLPDVAVIGHMTMIGGVDRGAVFILSELGSVRGLASLTTAAGAIIAGHGPTGAIGGYFYDVAGLGDLDGDGYDDLALSDPSGGVHVLLGPLRGAMDIGQAQLTVVANSQWDDVFGYSLAAGGDLDGDGVPDLVVGDHDADYNGASSGEVTVLSGAAMLAAMR